MARFLVTGATGLVGTAVADHLCGQGHDVVGTSRTAQTAEDSKGPGWRTWDGRSGLDVSGFDVIVHLAGASIGGRRWNTAYKQEIRESRVHGTRMVVDAITALPPGSRPGLLINASAVGYYGIAPEGVCGEDQPPGDDFLAGVVRDWESVATEAPTRVVRFRFGHVLGPGGLLERLRPIYKARLGGPMGSGRQGLPWVHVEDIARAVSWARQSDAEGPYNLASPEHVDQRSFSKALGRAMGVFEGIPLPGFALRIAAGGLGPYLLGGQHTPPKRLLDAGFRFRHEALDAALDDALRTA